MEINNLLEKIKQLPACIYRFSYNERHNSDPLFCFENFYRSWVVGGGWWVVCGGWWVVGSWYNSWVI